MQKKGGFGRNSDEPTFYTHYADRGAKDAARRAFGPRCLNCGDDTHFSRNCPAAYINGLNIIHPAVGEGTPAEVMTRRWRWQQRLCQWHQNRRACRTVGRVETNEEAAVNGRLAGSTTPPVVLSRVFEYRSSRNKGDRKRMGGPPTVAGCTEEFDGNRGAPRGS